MFEHLHDSRVILHTLRLKSYKIPKVVVSGLTLGYFVVWLRLDSMDNIGELHRVLNEKDRDVVPNDVPIALRYKHVLRDGDKLAKSK